ncbi:hypothetical protein FQA39_LY00693 [Lamprigera yunnana]|nr:hypothetical protein FQA39_LY00693 [Lamprigera yunnana]
MLTVEELNFQLSPSKWSKRVTEYTAVPLHIKVNTEVSNDVKKTVPCQLDVSYGTAELQKFDIYGTNLPSDAPIFIYIHGGYWQSLSKNISSFMVKPLHKNGIKVIVMGYRKCPDFTFSTVVSDIRKGFLKCVEYAKQNESKGLYLGGHSAGGHLSVSILDQFFDLLPNDDKNILKGVFLFSGLFDLIPLQKSYVNITLNLDDKEAKKFSPQYNAICTSHSTFFQVMVGEYDTTLYIEQSREFSKKLNNDGFKSEFIVIKNVDHFNLVENLSSDDYEISKLLIQKIKINDNDKKLNPYNV